MITIIKHIQQPTAKWCCMCMMLWLRFFFIWHDTESGIFSQAAEWILEMADWFSWMTITSEYRLCTNSFKYFLKQFLNSCNFHDQFHCGFEDKQLYSCKTVLSARDSVNKASELNNSGGRTWKVMIFDHHNYINGSVQDCSNSSA